MDKTEYRMKLDEINSLVDAQDYEGALQIADSIDWRRVKSIRTLCMVADIYEVNGRLEDSMKMLQLAYKRSSVGKMILYRLVELCLKMGRYDDAVSYYNEYLETASNDTSKYILKYKIYKAQKAPLDDQIQVLEEYKEREYTERWVYELARLYKKAGKERKCAETCDDLILWFGEGKYVTKALELKMTFTPLSASQREKYRKAAAGEGKTPQVSYPITDRSGDENKQEIPSGTVLGMEQAAVSEEGAAIPNTEDSGIKSAGEQKEAAGRDTVQQPAVDAGKIRENSVQLQERLARSFQEVLSGINRTKAANVLEHQGKALEADTLKMPEEENISEYQVEDLEPESAVEEVIPAEKGEAIVSRTETPEQETKEETEKPEDQEITSIQDMDLEALFAETSSMIAETISQAVSGQTAALKEEDEVSREEEPESEPEIVSEEPQEKQEESIVDIEEALARAAQDYVEETEEDAPSSDQQEAGQSMTEEEAVIQKEADPEEESGTPEEFPEPEDAILREEPEGGEDLFRDTDDQEMAMAAFAASLGELETGSSEEKTEVSEETVSEEDTETEKEDQEAAMEAFEAFLSAEVGSALDEDHTGDEKTQEPAVEDEIPEDAYTTGVDGNTADIEAQLRAVLGELPQETGDRTPEDELAYQLFGAEEDEIIPVREEELPVEEEEEPFEEEDLSDHEIDAEIARISEEISQEEDRDQAREAISQELDFTPEIDLDIVLEANRETEESEETEKTEEKDLDIQQMLEEAESEPQIPESLPESETPEEKRMRIMNETRPDKLTEQQKQLFSYFSKVPGMDQQILDAINGAHSYAGEKTSRRGNIAIMGSHGTGKTRLSDGLVKALCKDLGLTAAKYARLDASDMNGKDPARIIGKMAGGFLLIERAGYMNAETIEKLSKAMDFRTDSMILIIEDDKNNMRKLLADYPEFAEKFTTVISIPVFTNDELVTFARTYARENGYRMDEMGVLALYTLIGDNQREDEPITIGKVKEMVDGAIRRAGGGLKLGRRISKRHTDENGRIYLYEKDFDL